MIILLTLLHLLQWNAILLSHAGGPLVMLVRGSWALCQVTLHGPDAYANACQSIIGR